MANAALGLFDTYGEIGTKSYTLFRGNMYEGFAQDTWRAKPNLVIEYGARYSVMRPYYAPWGNQSFFDPAAWNPANAPTIDPVDRSGDRRQSLQRRGDSRLAFSKLRARTCAGGYSQQSSSILHG